MACGFFGKIPASGDFDTRGLPVGVQRIMDHWLTHHLAAYVARPDLWPESGLHAVLEGPNQPFVTLIVPSRDAVGRAYPLAIYAQGTGADRPAIELWGKKVHALAIAAIRDGHTADMLQAELEKCTSPNAAPVPLLPPALWGTGTGTEPQMTLRVLFNSA
jgi:type VI secretion system protein ImpM